MEECRLLLGLHISQVCKPSILLLLLLVFGWSNILSELYCLVNNCCENFWHHLPLLLDHLTLWLSWLLLLCDRFVICKGLFHCWLLIWILAAIITIYLLAWSYCFERDLSDLLLLLCYCCREVHRHCRSYYLVIQIQKKNTLIVFAPWRSGNFSDIVGISLSFSIGASGITARFIFTLD